jgi:death-on-curing family protein
MATQRITTTFVRNLNQQLTGQGVVVKPNELASALARPAWKQRYNPSTSMSALAATLAYGIIQDHPFMDGNKRTAFWVANEYLKDFGVTAFTTGTPDNTSTDVAMRVISNAHEKVASGTMDEAGLANEYKKILGF